MSRHTRRSLSLPARMAAAGVDRVFVAEATTLALGYGSQRLTNSRLWSDNMALRTRAEKAEAERDRLRDALANIAVMGFDNNPAVSDAIARSAVKQARAALKGVSHA